MNNPYSRLPDTRSIVSRLVLGLAGASLASGCSGYYPLGETSQTERWLTEGEVAGSSETADAHVAAVLAAPDLTISGSSYSSAVLPVGDLDGDGREELATTAFDLVNDVSSVHLRYGEPRPTDPLEAFEFDREGAHLAIRDTFGNPLGVAGAGDIDNDGYDDLLVTAGDCNTTQPGNGTYLVYGGPERLDGTLPLDGAAAHFVPPLRGGGSEDDARCNSNFSVKGVGDIDGDGVDDFVIVYNPQFDDNADPVLGTGEGVYVFYGKPQRFAGEIPYTDADAWLHTGSSVTLYAAGDVNADGLGDVLVTRVVPWPPEGPASYLIPGRTQRWSGALELETSTTPLGAARVPSFAPLAPTTGDFDGDGVSDVLFMDADRNLSLFYGAPGLFANGFDFADADAVLDASQNLGIFYAVGDRDADGDDELLDQFVVDDGPVPGFASDVAFASGSRQRLSGTFSFPESDAIAASPNGRFPYDPNRQIDIVVPAGDLDGDGAADLIAQSYHYELLDDGNASASVPQLHIHYGTPVTPSLALPR
jgi:hypothetical protein